MSIKKTNFWLEEPSILVTDLVFLPTAEMSREQKLNALTRLAVIIAAVMYVMESEHWSTFLLLSLLSLVVIEYIAKSKEESFSLIPTQIEGDFQSTAVAPIFSEEHRIPPPIYDMQNDIDYIEPAFEEPIRPQSYPYGQYLTRTNFLPSDEYALHMNPSGGAKIAREFANSVFKKHDMAFRENMTRIHKKSLERKFRHNTQDTYSPYHSY